MITALELRDDAALDRAYRIKTASEPGEPQEGAHQFRSLLRILATGDRQWCWRAGDDGFAVLRTEEASPDASVWVFVDPASRRRGTGRALLRAVVDQAREAGCRTVRGRHVDAAAFCSAAGAVEGMPNLRGLLQMPALDVGAAVDGYALRSWNGRTPDDLLRGTVDAREAMNDRPRTAGIAPEPINPARVRELEEMVLRRGLQRRVTAALDPTGRIVGFTEVWVDPEPGALATTEGTAVIPAHRGRGIATWIKAESLRRLRAERPDVDRVVTDNAETNAAMLAVNARLGFRTISRWRQAILEIT